MTTESVRGRFHKFDVGDRLRAAREIAGLSQDELSQLTGISRQTISNYELGLSKRPKSPYVAAIALATNFDKRWLEHGIEPGGGDDPSKLGGSPTGQKVHLPFSRLVHLPELGLVAAHSGLLPCPEFTVSTPTRASQELAA
jgi:transcriptional regulator with XRE-family HTH domain